MPKHNIINDNSPYKPPGCADSEYIELACMDSYRMDVFTDYGTIRGKAIDITLDGGAEFLVIEEMPDVHTKVRIDHIRKMIVLSTPRRFDEWAFARHAKVKDSVQAPDKPGN